MASDDTDRWTHYRQATYDVPRADGSTFELEVELEEWAARERMAVIDAAHAEALAEAE